MGGELLTKSTEATFKVAVDRYYVSDGILPIVALTSGEVVEIKSSLFSLSGLVSILNLTRGDNSQVYTNLSLVEKLRLWNSIRKLRPDQINFINLLETNILDEERQPDGSLIKIIDKDILKTVIADNFQDSAVRLENVTLEVVNATSEQRLAGQFSQILTNMGANVIGKSNSRSKQSGACLYFLKDKKYKRNTIIARVAELYSCKLLENYIQDSTADIVIILGEDFLK